MISRLLFGLFITMTFISVSSDEHNNPYNETTSQPTPETTSLSISKSLSESMSDSASSESNETTTVTPTTTEPTTTKPTTTKPTTTKPITTQPHNPPYIPPYTHIHPPRHGGYGRYGGYGGYSHGGYSGSGGHGYDKFYPGYAHTGYNQCNMFMNNGALYMQLQALAGVFLRGIDWLSSDNSDVQTKGLNLWETQLYPYMSDDFQMVNPEMGVLIESKKYLMDNALEIAEDRANGAMAVESFPYFECIQNNHVCRMKMYFNTFERNGDYIVWLHSSMTFEYEPRLRTFLLEQFQFEDPLSDEI